ncbi:uncharacterized protein LOC105221480 [Zeugodacus cucurbitae]|uniref:uncharacterized protein LOC105221480 n=1 Tax=Zeugodacus cucurbitae TaxID=28588 RepID=UPI0010A740B4|nr:uncharacterized protein LOC105221480 [Zeugodacus cucurbitae]
MKSRPNGQMNSGIAYFLLIICCLCQLTHTAKLREGCESLLNSTWVNVCNGIITKDIKIKYKDQLTKVGTPYKIMSQAKHDYLITFFKSDMHDCAMIDINRNMTMTCAKTKLIKMKPKLFHCFNFGLQYLADLMDLCFDQSDRLTIPTSHGMFTVLHYGHKPPLVSAQVRLSTIDSFAVGFAVVLTAVFMNLMRMNGICL